MGRNEVLGPNKLLGEAAGTESERQHQQKLGASLPGIKSAQERGPGPSAARTFHKSEYNRLSHHRRSLPGDRTSHSSLRSAYGACERAARRPLALRPGLSLSDHKLHLHAGSLAMPGGHPSGAQEVLSIY